MSDQNKSNVQLTEIRDALVELVLRMAREKAAGHNPADIPALVLTIIELKPYSV